MCDITFSRCHNATFSRFFFFMNKDFYSAARAESAAIEFMNRHAIFLLSIEHSDEYFLSRAMHGARETKCPKFQTLKVMSQRRQM